MALIVVVRSTRDRATDYDVDTSGVSIPSFATSEIPFDQGNDFSVSLSCPAKPEP